MTSSGYFSVVTYMPDPPIDKPRDPLPPQPRAPGAPGYAELHCKTNYSFLRGASHPDELVNRAAELGYAALAITDRHSVAGVVRAHVAAKASGLKLLVGAELWPRDTAPVVLLATNRAGYGRLTRLLTLGKRRAPKGDCELYFDDIAAHADDLLALVLLDAPHDDAPPTDKAQRTSPPLSIKHSALSIFRSAFGERCYALAELHRGPDDAGRLEQMVARARRARVPLAAANDVIYHAPERRMLQDTLTAIRYGCTVAEAGEKLFVNAERRLHAPAEILARFGRHSALVNRTLEIAARCAFSLDELRYEYPEELSPPGRSPLEYLVELTWAGARERYPDGLPDKVRGLIEHELQLIAELRYEAYFLTVWDLVRFARSRDILCQGRGSAANSAVCYCLGVTAVNPEQINVLFERFISRERNEAPDIDIDFEHERREEVLQYLYEKYGRERAGLTAEVITYRSRSAVRDVGKALGLSLEQVDCVAKAFDGRHHDQEWPRNLQQAGVDPTSLAARQLVPLAETLMGFPRHLSQHVGGMVITNGPLCELVPIENAAMADRTVVEWNKDDLDALGILKVDVLALGMLTAIRKCFALVEQHYGPRLTLANIPQEDPQVYEMTCRADTMGVFQIESRAQMSMLPRLQPRTFYDLVIEVAIVRPGPIQGKMVHPYLRRRAKEEAVTYPNEAIREVLDQTLGVPIFQEQAMRLAIVAAGFTAGEADQLRRAMGAWRKTGVIETFRHKLLTGMQRNGLGEEFAARVFEQISGFGEYGFPESHAASFALLVYVSAWLKHYYPAAFCAALINSQPMGFYAPAQLVRDAREHGVNVLPVDVNHSAADCTLEPHAGGLALRLGLRLVSGLPTAAQGTLVAARQAGPFRSLQDLARRARLSQAVLVRLASAKAFDSLQVGRRGALWQALAERPQEDRPLLMDVDTRLSDGAGATAALPALSPYEEVLADYQTNGLSLAGHPIEFFRDALTAARVVPNRQLRELKPGRVVRVSGLVLVRQRPGTASGITFVTLEDETGVANLVIRPDVWQRYRNVARGATAMIAQGRLERLGEVIHVLVTRLEDLNLLTAQIRSQSRDFR